MTDGPEAVGSVEEFARSVGEDPDEFRAAVREIINEYEEERFREISDRVRGGESQ